MPIMIMTMTIMKMIIWADWMCVWPLLPCWELAVQAFSGPQIQMEWIVIDNYGDYDDDDNDNEIYDYDDNEHVFLGHNFKWNGSSLTIMMLLMMKI